MGHSIDSPSGDLLREALCQPQFLSALAAAGWDLLVRQARRAGLLARIACMLEAQGSIELVPDAPRAHMQAAMSFGIAQHADAMRELAYIYEALAPTGVRPVLLKGAAYVAADLLPAMGRLFGNIDIMIPRERLAEVEAALMSHGWATTHHSADDQRYYREWMHGLPPLRHIRRQTVLEVHHAILPPTARLKPDSARLLASVRPLSSPQGFAVLCPADMVLDGMVHLFFNDDPSHALRNLSDLDLLLRQCGRTPKFWGDLVERANELDLNRPLELGLRYSKRLLATPVPRDVAACGGDPGRLAAAIDDWLWTRALRPQHPTATDRWTPLALSALKVRAHWLRMPPALLMRHLIVQAFRLNEPAPAPASQ